MTKKKKYTIGILSVLALIIAAFFIFSRDSGQKEYITEQAVKGDLLKTASVTGELKADEELDLNFEVVGRLKSVNAVVGDAVANGEILAIMDEAVLNKEVERAAAALDQASADAGTTDDVIREAEQAEDNADQFLEDTKSLEDQKVDAAKEDLAQAEDYYDDAKDYYEQVVADDGVDSAAAKSAKLTLTTAEKNKAATEEALETTRKARDLNVTSAENALSTAEEKVKTAKSNYTQKSKDSAVAQARANYELALVQLNKATLTAPVAGVITQVNFKKGEVVNQGSVNFGKILSKEYLLEADVPETDIVEVRVGQPAEVSFDALDFNETLSAKVVEIEPAATVIQDVVYYKVKLKLDSLDARLKPGMSGDIDIKTAQKSSVVMIPERAIKEENGQDVVEVIEGDTNVENPKIKKVVVKTGIAADEGMIEIVSGLEGGENIIVLTKEN